ncbi:uncharacterized protein [Epargyreus clarus]
MKFLLLTAALVAVAVAGPTQRLVHIGPDFIEKPISVGPEIIDQYHPISVGPEIIDQYHPISVGPEIIDQYHPISVGPEIIDQYHPISVGPEIVEEEHPISIGPEIIDEYHPISVGPAIINPPAVASSPMVQIIININKDGQVVGAPELIQNPTDIPEKPEIEPTPVDVVDVPITPVDVVELPPAIIGTPVLPEFPVISQPESLN